MYAAQKTYRLTICCIAEYLSLSCISHNLAVGFFCDFFTYITHWSTYFTLPWFVWIQQAELLQKLVRKAHINEHYPLFQVFPTRVLLCIFNFSCTCARELGRPGTEIIKNTGHWFKSHQSAGSFSFAKMRNTLVSEFVMYIHRPIFMPGTQPSDSLMLPWPLHSWHLQCGSPVCVYSSKCPCSTL